MFAKKNGSTGIRKKQLDDNNEPKLRFKTSAMNDNREGKKYFDSLNDNAKRNVLATVLGIKPEHVDIGGFEYDMLGKWEKKTIDDMAKTKSNKNEYAKLNRLQNEVNDTRPSLSISRNSKEYIDWAKKVNELGDIQERLFGVRLVSKLNDK